MRTVASPIILLVLLTLFGVGNALGFDSARVERVKAAFLTWAETYHVKDTSLVILMDGAVVGKVDRGVYTTATAVPIASDSKLITGLCIARLVEAGALDFNAPIGTVLADFFARHVPKDDRAKAITVAQLLTQSSGITNDPSQGSALAQFKPYTKLSAEKQVAVAFSKKLGTAPGSAYFYNNMNYAALGLIVEAVSGESYESYCASHVLAPVGVTGATLNPNWLSMEAYGGWKISADDYAKVMGYFDPARGLLSIPFAKWPKFSLGGGAFYSLGTLMRVTSNGFNFWHFGSWNAGSGAKRNFGSYFASWAGKTGVFADYTPTISGEAEGALDSALAGAALY